MQFDVARPKARRDRSGRGGAIGYVLTGGPVGTIVGAAAGGLIGAGH